MDIIEYVEKLDKKFINITKDYKYIYDNIHNYLNDGKVTYNQLMDFEVSLEDLSIQLSSLVFLFKQIQIDSIVFLFNQKKTNGKIDNNNKETKVDYIIEKTIFNFIPCLFMYFMIFDKESLLYAKDFIENKYDNVNDTVNDNHEFQYIIEPIDE